MSDLRAALRGAAKQQTTPPLTGHPSTGGEFLHPCAPFPSSGGVDGKAGRGGLRSALSGEAGRGGVASHSWVATAASSDSANRTGTRDTATYLSLPYNPKLRERARELRKAGNLSEVLLWNRLKRGQLMGLDFDRQKIIGDFIVDFFCADKRTVVEVDGRSHDDKVEYDAQRDAFLIGLGLKVIHVPAKDVMRNLDAVMETLEHVLAAGVSADHPAPAGHPSRGGEFLHPCAPFPSRGGVDGEAGRGGLRSALSGEAGRGGVAPQGATAAVSETAGRGNSFFAPKIESRGTKA
ncbi:MAG TPA: DUF559 domain-containing protein [Fibrobacteria bacterium]|nr:DUF559 domain-containing protein [Fibrobacteria bacterium]